MHRTCRYMHVHRDTRGVQAGGERGWMNPHLPVVFDTLQYFETIFPSVESLYFDILYKLRHILWVVSLLEARDITNNGGHLGRHLRFYKELEIR